MKELKRTGCWSCVCVLALGLVLVEASPEGEDEWRPLFDGSTLAGWQISGKGKWRVEDGEIVATASEELERNGLLFSKQRYRDFVIRFEFKVKNGNSGFYFRAEKRDDAVGLKAYQAEIPGEINEKVPAGGIHESGKGGRGWLMKPEIERVREVFKPGEWNRMEVSAQGNRITTTLNGKRVCEIDDEKGAREGFLAFQLHRNKKMAVRFRKIEMKGVAVE